MQDQREMLREDESSYRAEGARSRRVWRKQETIGERKRVGRRVSTEMGGVKSWEGRYEKRDGDQRVVSSARAHEIVEE